MTSVKVQAKYLPAGWIWTSSDNQISGCLKSPDGDDVLEYDTKPYKRQGWIAYRKSSEKEWRIYYSDLLSSFQRFAECDTTIDQFTTIKRVPLF